jgi:hypothetical protein
MRIMIFIKISNFALNVNDYYSNLQEFDSFALDPGK